MGIVKAEHKIVSIIGMSKNSGKTVTLGHLIEEAFDAGRVLGLTSIGRDGETTDIVTASDKPRIYVYEGTYIATAEMLFGLCEAKMEIVEVTRFSTPMGKVIIARALEDGYVQIGGANANKDIRTLADKMLAYGADLVFVDGALDRSSSASPVISDSCVLASGAAVDRYMHNTIAKTVHLAELFKLPKVSLDKIAFTEGEARSNGPCDASAGCSADFCRDASHRDGPPERLVARNADSSDRVLDFDTLMDLFDKPDAPEPVLIDRFGTITTLHEIKTALGAGRKIAEAVDENTRYIVIKGALINKTLRDFIEATDYYRNIEWVIRDATRLFLDALEWKYILRAGVAISVVSEVQLLAITANPTSPYSYSYDPDAFLEGLREKIEDVPVINVMALEV